MTAAPRPRWTTAALTLVILALLPAQGLARGRADQDVARKHYKAGKAAYAAGQYRQAAKAFSAGYLHDSKPAFLINIAQSYRKADDPKQALYYYREYLKVAVESPLANQVKGLVGELEREIARQEQPPPAPAAVVIRQLPPPPPPPRSSPPFYKRWWFWAGVGAVVVTGVTVGIVAGTRGPPDYVEEGGMGSISW